MANVAPKAYQVYYGLGEIAYRQNDTEAAIKKLPALPDQRAGQY